MGWPRHRLLTEAGADLLAEDSEALLIEGAYETDPVYSCTIGAAEQPFLVATFEESEALMQVGTLSAEVVSETAIYRPALRDEVIITENGDRIFGGIITSVVETGFGGPNVPAIVSRIEARDFHVYAEQVYLTGTYSDQTPDRVKQVVEDIATLLADYGVTVSPDQADGPVLPRLQFDQRQAADILNEIHKHTGWCWRIDHYKVLRAFPKGAIPAPFPLTEGLGVECGDVEVEHRLDDYANRVVVVAGAVAAMAVEDTVVGDGVTSTFDLTYDIIAPLFGYVEINGGAVNEDIGTSPAQWSFDAAAKTFTREIGPLGNGDTARLRYSAQFPFSTTAEDVAEQAAHGLWTVVIREPDLYDAATAAELAAAELARRLTPVVLLHYPTRRIGLAIGQTQPADLPSRAVSPPDDFLITELLTRVDGSRLQRDVSASDSDSDGEPWRQFYRPVENYSIGVPAESASTQGPVGPAGPEGPAGPTGDPGEDGVDGADGADGTVIDEYPGTSQTMTLVGAGGSWDLEFTNGLLTDATFTPAAP